MYISARERQILEILLKTTDETTVKDLADLIGVSGRTIHRDLKNIEDILDEYNLTLQKKIRSRCPTNRREKRNFGSGTLFV
ncbi:HTH domain-containing protein [Bacillus sp. OTU2372]|uniref:HTH domain-containing protein n=1 Tax=Bacillus sp. OTU2372 TaxID=3043858 RepID=UPI00313F1DA8